VTHTQAKEVLDKYSDRLMSYPNVTGVGIHQVEVNGQLEPALQVYVTRKRSLGTFLPWGRIPNTLDGVRVDVEEVGRFVAE
jgi:hypothetical protein